MDRYSELLKAACPNDADNTLFKQLALEAADLERRLEELRKMPFIKVHPTDPTKQKATPAAKQYKELLQQYTNIIKILARQGGGEDDNEESPLRAWAKRKLADNAY